MIPVEDVQALHAEAKALRAEHVGACRNRGEKVTHAN